tara:strand:- start:354 stop:479 length:126 start_codon:yes stop_codon:yes gene_type:complete
MKKPMKRDPYVDKKISQLVKEGRPRKQAVAIAIAMSKARKK